jgi:hypothetical protein
VLCPFDLAACASFHAGHSTGVLRFERDVLRETGFSSRRLSDLVGHDSEDILQAEGVSGAWRGWTPGSAPIVLRDVGAQDIYALEWQPPR